MEGEKIQGKIIVARGGGEKISGGCGGVVVVRRRQEDAWVRDQEPPARQARDTLVRGSLGFSRGRGGIRVMK